MLLRAAKQFRPSLGGSEQLSHFARFVKFRTKRSASWFWILVVRTSAAAGPSDEIDSSSAGAMDNVIRDIGAMAAVSAGIVKSISTTMSFPPNVNRRV